MTVQKIKTQNVLTTIDPLYLVIIILAVILAVVRDTSSHKYVTYRHLLSNNTQVVYKMRISLSIY